MQAHASGCLALSVPPSAQVLFSSAASRTQRAPCGAASPAPTARSRCYSPSTAASPPSTSLSLRSAYCARLAFLENQYRNISCDALLLLPGGLVVLAPPARKISPITAQSVVQEQRFSASTSNLAFLARALLALIAASPRFRLTFFLPLVLATHPRVASIHGPLFRAQSA